MGQHPQSDGDGENGRSGAAEEDFGAINQAQSEAAESGQTVGRHLQHERSSFALENRGFQDPGGGESGEKAQDVQSEEGSGAGTDRADEETLRDQGGDGERGNGQA